MIREESRSTRLWWYKCTARPSCGRRRCCREEEVVSVFWLGCWSRRRRDLSDSTVLDSWDLSRSSSSREDRAERMRGRGRERRAERRRRTTTAANAGGARVPVGEPGEGEGEKAERRFGRMEEGVGRRGETPSQQHDGTNPLTPSMPPLPGRRTDETTWHSTRNDAAVTPCTKLLSPVSSPPPPPFPRNVVVAVAARDNRTSQAARTNVATSREERRRERRRIVRCCAVVVVVVVVVW